LSTFTAFATILGLVGNFSAGRRNEAAASYEEFMEWLIKSNHAEVVDLISQNATTIIGVKALLSVTRQEMGDRLNQIDASLARIASGFEELRPLALAVYPQSELSEQALSVLSQLVDSGASKMLALSYLEGFGLQYIDGDGGALSCSEPRFIDDDPASLVDLGLLRLEHNS